MSKKVLIISTSLRNNSNSEILAQEAERGACDAGHDVEFISLREKEIKFCKGCLACQKIGACVIKDDSNEIVEKMKHADVIVFASPIYYYEMAGQLKTLLDRGNCLYASDYKFRDIYFLAAAADTDSHAADTAVNGLQGWIACYPKAKLKGVVLGAGAETAGDIRNNPAMKQAYETGKSI